VNKTKQKSQQILPGGWKGAGLGKGIFPLLTSFSHSTDLVTDVRSWLN
jgi:hypothetical protein